MRTIALKAEREQQREAEAAVIHIDSHGAPCLSTREALRVLLYPQELPENGKALRLAWRQIRFLFPAGPLAGETVPFGEFSSGRRRYQYRLYRLTKWLGEAQGPAAIIILERCSQPLVPTPDSLAPYNLTVREEQVLRHVLRGLSNKQIAENMGISPNTVKAFLRLLMTKMGVTSRFGVLGKVLGQAQLRPRLALRPSISPVARFRVARSR